MYVWGRKLASFFSLTLYYCCYFKFYFVILLLLLLDTTTVYFGINIFHLPFLTSQRNSSLLRAIRRFPWSGWRDNSLLHRTSYRHRDARSRFNSTNGIYIIYSLLLYNTQKKPTKIRRRRRKKM